MNDIFDLSNKVILITGGYGYLAQNAAKYMAKYNARVYIMARNEEKFLQIFKDYENIYFQIFDLSSTISIKNAFESVYKKENKIDVLINNAFYLKGQSPENMEDEDFSYGIEGVLNRMFICIREIIPYLKRQGFGKIINISSMYGLVAPDFSIYNVFPEQLNPPHYGAAKAGVIQLTKYYAAYLGKNNIQVNVITPGPFPSLKTQQNKEFISNLSSHTILNRIGHPDDLIGVFVLLSTKSSDYITGQNFIVDGGWTVK